MRRAGDHLDGAPVPGLVAGPGRARTPEEVRNALILAADAQAKRIAALEERLDRIADELRELRRRVLEP